ncbi:hypothetical protein BDQ17DRAFT_1327364 [Cyathus striatus]|nr:hypothetical protein BDQ17DRAFT_1327364 [Cyathus striatus]
MDTSEFSTVGRYGTISLLKRNEPNTVVTAFGIDSEELTFGRDPSCSVRLYYPDVSLVHCKVVFEERKKRFRFSYPPKDMRAMLLSTPPRPNNRSLRLSMIHSAQVFSPRPSNDPRENLRILKSPLKNTFKSPAKPSTLSRPPVSRNSEDEDDEEDEEESIILVDGNCPRVVEEERDLVILEDVELSQEPPQTPRRRSQSRNTLHRAVLIRSAQRAVIRAEREREEHEEEMEVLEQAVAVGEESEEEDEESEDDMDVDEPERRHEDDNEYYSDDEEEGDHDDEDGHDEYQEKLKDEGDRKPFYQQKSLFRKSLENLEKLWPFRSLSPGKEEGPSQEPGSSSESESDSEGAHQLNPESQGTEPGPSDDEDAHDVSHSEEDEDEEANEEPASLARMSLGYGPQRVRIEEPWKVKDIVVPLKNGTQAQSSAAAADRQTSPTRNVRRPTLSEEEKKAIQERRRSAVRQPDNFFGGGVPGMTPSKGKPVFYRPSMSPAKVGSRDNDENPFLGSSSPVRGSSFTPGHPGSDDDDVDTRSLLERMKETVEGMKRRRSVAAPGGLVATPRASKEPETKDEDHTRSRTPVADVVMDDVKEDDDKEEQDEPMAMDETDDDKENSPSYEKPFSLLRPGARDETFVRRQSVVVLEKAGGSQAESSDEDAMKEDNDVDIVPTVIVEPTPKVEEHIEVDEEAPVPRATGRRLRVKKSPALEVPEEKEASTSKRTTPRLRSKSPRPAALNVQEDAIAEEPEQPEEDTSRLRTSTRQKSQRSRSRTPQVQHEEPSAAEEEQTHAENLEVVEEASSEPAPVKAPARRSRTRKATAEPEDPPQVLVPAPDKRGKKAAVESEIVAPTAARRGRKGTAEPAEPPKEEQAPARRGRKPAVKEEPESMESAEVTPVAVPSRRGRKPAATPASEPVKPTQLPIPKDTVLKSVPVRKTRTAKSKAAEVEAIPVDDDDDPLDSIGVMEEEVVPTVKARGKKKAPVKEEPEEDAPPATRAGRSRSATATRSTAATKTPATATKSKLPRKAPATVPAASSSTEVDKENAPRSRSTSGKSSPAEPEGVAAVKVRVSRSTRATKAPAAQIKEEVEEPEKNPAGRGRVMRSTRKVKAT